MSLEDKQAVIKAELKARKPKQKPYKPKKNMVNLSDKHKAFLLLKENGEKTETIANTLNYHPKYAYQLGKNLEKYSLKDKKMVVSASKAIKNILKGKTFGSIEEIKDSTALGAAKMVYDRIEPAVNVSQSSNLNVNIDVVDMSRYRGEVGTNAEKEP